MWGGRANLLYIRNAFTLAATSSAAHQFHQNSRCMHTPRTASVMHAQDWLRTNRPEVYEQTQYTCVEISTRLAAQQYESVVTKAGQQGCWHHRINHSI